MITEWLHSESSSVQSPHRPLPTPLVVRVFHSPVTAGGWRANPDEMIAGTWRGGTQGEDDDVEGTLCHR